MKCALKRTAAHWLLAAALWGGMAWGQTDSTDDQTNQAIEDLIQLNEVDEQVDYTFITDELNDLLRKPLDLNRASPEQLRYLPGVANIQIAALAQHRARYGDLASVYELQAVEGWDNALIRNILPYVTVRGASLKDLNPDGGGNRAPTWQRLREDLHTEFTQRFAYQFEQRKGFTPPDTTASGSLTSRYGGGPLYTFTRLRLRSGPYASAAIVLETDDGEPWAWNPRREQLGYDFVAAHVALSNFGRLRMLVVGDYTAQFGQGIAMSRGLGFGKGAGAVANVKMASVGIRPYASVNENQFLRGAAATYAWGQVQVTGFASRNALDATVQATASDSLSEAADEGLSVSNLQLGGLHRTPSEIANRNAIAETLGGGRVAWHGPRLVAGATGYVQDLGAQVRVDTNAYNRFDFAGRRNSMASADVDWVWRNVNFFGECARSASGGIGAVGGFMASLAPEVDLALVARNFDRDFHTFKGFAFAERTANPQNERGLYIGTVLRPTPKWTLSAYLDQYAFPYNRYQVAYPSRGHEFLAQADYKYKRGTTAYLRIRTETRQGDAPASELPPGQQIEVLRPETRQQIRLQLQHKISRTLEIRARAEGVRYQAGSEAAQYGLLVYQDVVWKPTFKFRVACRYALFQAEDFDARVYAYENDIMGAFSIPGLYRTGSRAYALFTYKPRRGLTLQARISQTRYEAADPADDSPNPPTPGLLPPNRYESRYTNGSGLEAVQGRTRTELKAQVIWAF